MSDHKTVRMVERVDGTYRRVTDLEYHAMKDRYILEGVDGDEETNTVIYWYRRRTEDDE